MKQIAIMAENVSCCDDCVANVAKTASTLALTMSAGVQLVFTGRLLIIVFRRVLRRAFGSKLQPSIHWILRFPKKETALEV